LEESIKEKVSIVSIGKHNSFIVTDNNVVYRMGYSKDGHLGINESYN